MCALALVMASSCTVIETVGGAPVADSVDALVAAKKINKLTTAEVCSALGPPSVISSTPTGAVMLYEYLKVTEHQFGLSLDTFIPAPELQ